MASDWEYRKLKDILALVADNRGRNPESYSEKGIPVIDNYLIISEGYINLKSIKRFINDNTYDSFIRKHIQEDDVLITLVGNGYGQVALTPPEKCVIIQNTVGLRCNINNDNKFLYYLLKNNRKALMNLNIGAAQPSIKVGNLTDLEFHFPPLPEQKAIAQILGSLDDKIELNRQMNETLEAMAQALFKSWFVDFDPVIDNAIKAGKPIPDEIAARAELRKKIVKKDNPEIQRLFPDEFEFTEELGWIPKGWRILKFKDIADTKQGKYLANDKIVDIPDENYIYPVWGGNGVRGFSQYSLFNKSAVVLTCRGSNCGLLKITESEAWITNSSFCCIPKLGSTYFLYLYFLNKNFSSSVSGSAQPQITYTALKNNIMKFPVCNKVVENFSSEVEILREKQIFNQRLIKILTQLRDTLLPKLMSGEIRVSDAAAMVEDA